MVICEVCTNPVAEVRLRMGAKTCGTACRKERSRRTSKVRYTDGRARLTYESQDCAVCGNAILGPRLRNGAKTCSTACHQKRVYRFGSPLHQKGISTGTIGAVSELLVAADLMSKGYEVFRALSPASSCDLAILKNGALLRVEVRTMTLTRTGKLTCDRSHRADILAAPVVNDGNRIVYEPSLIEDAEPCVEE